MLQVTQVSTSVTESGSPITIEHGTECVITMEPIREQQTIGQCLQCNKVFDYEALSLW